MIRRSIARLLLVLALTVLLAASASAESTISCPPGTVDMLDWMTLDSDLRAGSHMTGTHPIYTSLWPDKVWYAKDSSGTTWDINLYDQNYIYGWITELNWGNPRDFKKSTHNTNFPMSPRCAVPGYPGSANAISNTEYDIYVNCQFQSRQNLAKAITEVWGPFEATLWGDLPPNLPVMVVSYRYGCDNSYWNCSSKEEFVYAQRYGLVRWAQYELINNSYQQTGISTFNTLASGTAPLVFPCF
jgi:hypothetical protein